MKKIKLFTLIFSTLFVILPLIDNIRIPFYAVEADPMSYLTSYSIENHKKFDESYLEISTEIPESWQIKMAFENKSGEDYVINKRIILNDNENRIIVDIWKSNGLSLKENFIKLESSFLKESTKDLSVNGKINGLDVIFSSDLSSNEGNLRHLSAMFQTNKFIYRINYPIVNEEKIVNYITFLRNFKLKSRQKNNEYNLDNLNVPKIKKIIGLEIRTKVYASQNCGNYTMPSGVNNNFPCCSNGGNCTWWAIYKRNDLADIITWGNAGSDWISQAKQANIPISYSASAGFISVWGPKDGRSGHVAYVNSINGNKFNVSEMNCDGTDPGPRNVDAQSNYSDYWSLEPLGFIGFKDRNLIIQNQIVNGGTFTSNSQIKVYPESRFTPTVSDIILKIQ